MKKILIVSAALGITSLSAMAFACGGHGKKADTNGDGKVTLAEVQAAAKERFDGKDANKDGVLSKAELDGRGTRMMERADANKDGQLTRAEGELALKSWFSEHDQNKDGALTKDEMPRRGEGKGRGPKGEGHGRGPKDGRGPGHHGKA